MQLTQAQKTSSLFSEEPMVMGKALRRGLPPLRIDEAQFKQNQIMLKRLFDAGAINIKAVDGEKVVDFREEEAEKKIASSMPSASDELKEMKAPPPPPAQIVEQHQKDRDAELQALAGEATAVAPAGDAPPAGVAAPEVVPPDEGGKVEDSSEGHHKKRRGKRES
jgi:hypothetical protein